jgi:hypothetical protein
MSDHPRRWVEERQGHWNHQDWLSLLEGLQASEFWPMEPDAVGLHIERLKRDYHSKGAPTPPVRVEPPAAATRVPEPKPTTPSPAHKSAAWVLAQVALRLILNASMLVLLGKAAISAVRFPIPGIASTFILIDVAVEMFEFVGLLRKGRPYDVPVKFALLGNILAVIAAMFAIQLHAAMGPPGQASRIVLGIGAFWFVLMTSADLPLPRFLHPLRFVIGIVEGAQDFVEAAQRRAAGGMSEIWDRRWLGILNFIEKYIYMIGGCSTCGLWKEQRTKVPHRVSLLLRFWGWRWKNGSWACPLHKYHPPKTAFAVKNTASFMGTGFRPMFLCQTYESKFSVCPGCQRGSRAVLNLTSDYVSLFYVPLFPRYLFEVLSCAGLLLASRYPSLKVLSAVSVCYECEKPYRVELTDWEEKTLLEVVTAREKAFIASGRGRRSTDPIPKPEPGIHASPFWPLAVSALGGFIGWHLFPAALSALPAALVFGPLGGYLGWRLLGELFAEAFFWRFRRAYWLGLTLGLASGIALGIMLPRFEPRHWAVHAAGSILGMGVFSCLLLSVYAHSSNARIFHAYYVEKR